MVQGIHDAHRRAKSLQEPGRGPSVPPAHNQWVKHRFLDALESGILVFDGAIGTQIQAAGLQAEDYCLASVPPPSPAWAAAAERTTAQEMEGCPEVLCVTRPDFVTDLHSKYLAAGADIVETNSFGSTSVVLGEYGVPELVADCCRAAAQCARAAVEKSGEEAFVAGGLGPGTRLMSLGQLGWDEALATYTDGFSALLEGGADFLLLETMQDLLMVKMGVAAANDAMARTGIEVPVVVQVTVEQTGTLLVGTDISAALNLLECFPSVVAIGMNCATGPAEMSPHVRFLGANSTRPLSIQPNAGLPRMEQGRAVYDLTPTELAEHHVRFVTENGAALVGGCCGTGPEHIAAVKEAVKDAQPSAEAHWVRSRRAFPGFDFHHYGDDQDAALALVGCSSLYGFEPYEQDSSLLIIGEKTNANGSKAFREMLVAENWDGLVELAREQEAEGSHMLDVCAAYVGRDEARDLGILAERFNLQVTVPLMVDTTQADALEAALKRIAGKCIVNSINFEDGEDKARAFLAQCRRYGAGVVALTIDEAGMALEADRKVEIADRLIALTREYGLPDHDVFIDALTLTLGSGDEASRKTAIATLEAITEIKRRHPRVNTVLGVSNVSFGLKPAARALLNSVFLRHAQDAGLSAAIIHATKIRRESEIPADLWQIASDLVFDRRRFEQAV